MKFPWTPKREPEVEAYLAGTSRRYRRKDPTAEAPFVVLDTEASGFQLHTDKILSVATMSVQGNRAETSSLRHWLIRRTEADVTPATRIHTILPSDSSEGTPEKEVLGQLLPILTGSIIVGHHIGFDIAMLNRAFQEHYNLKLKNRYLDTAVLAQRVLDAYRRTGYANQRPPGLDEVVSHLGLTVWERHTADGDTFATGQLFLLLCARLRRQLERELVLSDLPLT
ncbi:MAG: 3'-5' exonuclease [Verrucomicrobiota bacterium JB023]|nr:3'-5' exonuclease [Verrucomicrobiota bacterium JB023]